MSQQQYEPEPWLADNYRGVLASGEDPEHIATQLEERGTPALAAWVRSQAA